MCPITECFRGSFLTYSRFSLQAFVAQSFIANVHEHSAVPELESSATNLKESALHFVVRASTLAARFLSKCKETLSLRKK